MSERAYDTNSWRRVNTREHCPVCDHGDGCIIYDDGGVICLHVKSEQPVKEGKGLGGWYHRPDNRAPYTRPERPPARLQVVQVDEALKADADTLHRVYSDLMQRFPVPVPYDGDGLHALTDEQAARYAWLPFSDDNQHIVEDSRRRALRELEEAWGRHVLLSVPGFYERADGSLGINGAGLLLPRRDEHGRITAIDVRRKHAESGRKYYLLSSTKYGGPGPGAPVHVAMPAGGVRVAGRVGVTEGVKKADAAADALGYPFIGLPGFHAWNNALPIFDALDADCVVIALDQDEKPATRARVDEARQRLAKAAHAAGYAVRMASWSPAQGKGIDDILRAGYKPIITRYQPEPGTADASPDATAMAAVLAAQYAKLAAAHQRAMQRQKAITGVIGNESIAPSEKVVAVVAMLEANRYPGVEPTDDKPLQRVSVASIATRANVGLSTAGRYLKHAGDVGIITRKVEYARDEQGKVKRDVQGKPIKEQYIGAGRLIGLQEPIPEAEHRPKDRERPRCWHCYSDDLSPTGYACNTCGAMMTATEAVEAGRKIVEQGNGVLMQRDTGELITPGVPVEVFEPADDGSNGRCAGNDNEQGTTLIAESAIRPSLQGLSAESAISPATPPDVPPKPDGRCPECRTSNWYYRDRWEPEWVCAKCYPPPQAQAT